MVKKMRVKNIEKLNKDSTVLALCWICERPFKVNELLVKELFVSNPKYIRMFKGYVFKCQECEKKLRSG